MIIIKSQREIEKMRVAGKMTAAVMDRLEKLMCPGRVTEEIDALAEKLIRDKGGIPAFKGYMGYPASVCVSINEEVVHGIPGKRILQDGDIVSLDLGVLYDGYYGDMARTFPVGKMSESARDLIETAEQALERGTLQSKQGGCLGDISNAIESFVVEKGYTVVRDYVGHGIGKKLHEEPQVPNYGNPGTGPRLEVGMVLAIEPMVNMGTYDVQVLQDNWTVITRDKKISAHFENTVVIGENGPEVITCQKKKH
jgi:methionyl aminopeptidase